MTTCRKLLFFLLIFAFAVKQPGLAEKERGTPAGTSESATNTPVRDRRIADKYDILPLAFETNAGQADAEVKFLSRGKVSTLFLTNDEAIFSLKELSRKTPPRPSPSEARRVLKPLETSSDQVLRMKLEGANPIAEIVGLDELPGKINYFIGSDPKKWRSNIPTYTRVKYKNIYPGIDLVYYGSHQQLEYDFVLSAGADPRHIKLAIGGAKVIKKDHQGNLILRMETGEVKWKKPVVLQEGTGGSRSIPVRYVLSQHHTVRIEVGKYDSSRPLLIDPALSYSTFIGGSNNDNGSSIVVDASGNAYIAGQTQSTDFPTTSGAFQTVCKGCYDAFVTKLNPAGTALIYSTYLGGSGTDYALGVAVNASGNAYLTGNSSSTDFPITSGAFQTTCNNGTNCSEFGDGFVTELNPTGSALIYSTYLGGSNVDQGQAIVLDAAGDALVTGLTASSDFPTSSGAYQTVYGGGNYDAFVSALNPEGSALIFSTFLGGAMSDYANGIAIDPSGNTYLTGETCSENFPTTIGAFQTQYGGGYCDPGDAFISKLSPEGSSLIYSTYLGGSSFESAFGIAVDQSGAASVTGFTCSTNFPVTPGVFQPTYKGGTCLFGDAFVTRLNPSGSALSYSTYLGGTSSDVGFAIALDSSGNTYVTGQTQSIDFPTTLGGFQTSCSGVCADAFVTSLNPTAEALTYSTYLGGTGSDQGLSITVDGLNNFYATGLTSSPDFPVTPAAFQPSCSDGCSYTDGFVVKFVQGPQLWPLNLNFGDQTVGMSGAPQVTTLTNSTDATLNISAISITGPNPSDFSQTNTCGTALQQGGNCAITVTFIPSNSGTRTADVAVTDDGANSPQMVPLTGIGVTPEVTLTPTALTFPTQVVFTSSKSQAVTLENNGLGVLQILSIAATGQFGQSNTCGTTVAPGATCTIEVTFRPKTKGTIKGSISVNDNAPGSPQSVTLTGTGTYIQLLPASVNFGSQPVHTTSLPKTITLTNKGSTTVSINNITINGSNAADFSETNTCGSSVAAGGSCFIKVTFTPSAKGKRLGNISVSDSGGGSPQVVPLLGTGT